MRAGGRLPGRRAAIAAGQAAPYTYLYLFKYTRRMVRRFRLICNLRRVALLLRWARARAALKISRIEAAAGAAAIR